MSIIQANKIKELAGIIATLQRNEGYKTQNDPEHILFHSLISTYSMMGINTTENKSSQSQGLSINPSLSDSYTSRINSFNSTNPIEVIKNDQTYNNQTSKPQEEFNTEREKSINLDSVTKVKIDSKLKTDEFFTLLKRNTDWYSKQMKALQAQKEQKQIDIDEYFALEEKISNQHTQNMDTIHDLRKNDKKGTINFTPIVTPQEQEIQATTATKPAKAQNPYQAFANLENENTISKSEALDKLQQWFREERAKLLPTENPELYFTETNLAEYEKKLDPIKKEFQEKFKAIQKEFNEGKLSGSPQSTSNYTFPYKANPSGQLFELTVKVNDNAINRFGDPVELIRRPNGELHAIFINPENGEKVAVPVPLANPSKAGANQRINPLEHPIALAEGESLPPGYLEITKQFTVTNGLKLSDRKKVTLTVPVAPSGWEVAYVIPASNGRYLPIYKKGKELHDFKVAINKQQNQ